MNINENDMLITGGSMAQDQQSIDPLHMVDPTFISGTAQQNEPYPFTEKELKLGRLFIEKIGSYDRAYKLFDYLGRKDAEYQKIIDSQKSPIDDIAAAMPDDDYSLQMQDYMNKTTNPGADGPY